jgi:hypothetical protein
MRTDRFNIYEVVGHQNEIISSSYSASATTLTINATVRSMAHTNDLPFTIDNLHFWPEEPTTNGAIPIIRSSLSDPTLNTLAAQFSDIEQMRIATASRLRILTLDEADEDGVMRGWALPENHPSVIALRYQFEAFEIQEKTMEKALAKQLKTHPLHPWIKSQTGLGDKQMARLLGVIRDPYWNELYQRPRTVSELWAYSGLHVIDGQCAKRRKGQQSNWSAEAKSRIYLIAVSCIKQSKSPYRAVYDDRRAHTAITHPDWTDGHSHNDALRIMGKEILKQLWIQSRAIHEGE